MYDENTTELSCPRFGVMAAIVESEESYWKTKSGESMSSGDEQAETKSMGWQGGQGWLRWMGPVGRGFLRSTQRR